MSHQIDNPTTICDKCGEKVLVEETQNGPEGTEWENCTLCNECYSEENHDNK